MKRFFQNLFASKKNTTSAKRTGVRPQVEALEDRLVPATLGVDGGVLTYRADAGETNNLVVTRNQNGSYTFSDSVSIRFGNQVGQNITVPAGTNFNSILLEMRDRNDTVRVNSVGHTMTINGGGGDDVITLGSNTGGMARINGNVTVNGGAENLGDRLVLNDQSAQNSQAYAIRSNSVNRTGAGMITYGGLERLTLSGTNNADQFDVVSTAVATPVNINAGGGDDVIRMGSISGNLNALGSRISLNGGAGRNWLDYSQLTSGSGVTVDLAAATANGVATGFQNIQNVRGSRFGDTVTGDANNNILVGVDGDDKLNGGGNLLPPTGFLDLPGGGVLLVGGGHTAGRDILIGGRGVDTLDGGLGDDILIGDRTNLDENSFGLQRIMAEWESGSGYDTRTRRIAGQETGGANGDYRLNADSVFNDRSMDDITGGAEVYIAVVTDSDWFFSVTDGEIRDQGIGERVN